MFCNWLMGWMSGSGRARSPAQWRHRPPYRLQLEVLEDRTVPSFLPPVAYSTPSGPAAPVVGQFVTGSGNLDIATANYISNNVTVLLNNGDGTFAPGVSYPAGPSLEAIAAGDLANNGNLDIVVTNYTAGTVTVLLGTGLGTFVSGGTFSTGGSGPIGIALADVNGDGNLDAVVTNYNSETVSVLPGDGLGGFGPPISYSVGGSTPIAVDVAQTVAGSGNLDIAVALLGSGGVRLLYNQGDGTFALGPYYDTGVFPDDIKFADVNNDALPDLIVPNFDSNTVSVLLGNGDGTFQRALNTPVSGEPGGVAVADFNQDGNPDLAVVGYGGSILTILLGNGNGTFTTNAVYGSPGKPSGVATGDFNNDGFPDVVTTNYGSNQTLVYINAADWSAGPSAPLFLPGQPPLAPFSSKGMGKAAATPLWPLVPGTMPGLETGSLGAGQEADLFWSEAHTGPIALDAWLTAAPNFVQTLGLD